MPTDPAGIVATGIVLGAGFFLGKELLRFTAFLAADGVCLMRDGLRHLRDRILGRP